MLEITRKDLINAAGLTSLVMAAPAAARPFARTHAATPRRTLIRGGDILTMERGEADRHGVDLLIESGRIAAIGQALTVADAEIVDGRGCIVMPGMIDGHRHIWSGIDLGRITNTSDVDYDEWKMRIMAALTPEDAYFSEYVGGLATIDAGVTSVVDFCHGLHTPELVQEGARGIIDSGVGGYFCWQIAHVLSYGLGDTVTRKQGWDDRNAPPTEMHYRTAAALRDNHFAAGRSPMRFGLALSNNSLGRLLTDVVEEFRRVREIGPELITHHVRSTRANPPLAPGYYRNIRDLTTAGLIGPDYHTTHSNDWSDEELKMLGDAGGMLCSAPLSAETSSRHNYTCMFGRAHAVGVRVGLGLDAPLKNVTDYFELIRAGLNSQFRKPETWKIASEYTADDMLGFATREGAAAIGMADEVGTLKVGKRADILMLKTDRYGFPMWGGLADRVVHFAAQTDIDSVWIAGRRLKKDGALVGVDWSRLKLEGLRRQIRLNRDADTVTVVD